MDHSIQPTELAQLLRGGKPVNIIDVRTPAEFQEIHLDGARNIPLHQIDTEDVQRRYANEPLFVICQKGSRGRQACEQLRAAGLVTVQNVEGGTEACIAHGLPVVRGRRAISLERQVRIAAGSLVLVGAVLAWLVHPLFVALSGLIGAGLVFSGITDTCGMGILLARMPWNQLKWDTRCEAAVSEKADY